MNLIGTEFDEGVLTVTLQDEENRNALSVGLTSELAQTLDEAEGNPDVRVIILTNSGRVFCAGADLSERSSRKEDKSSTKPIDPLEIFGRFRESSKPYIGKISGHCVAGGMGIAAAMDISISIEEAKFGFTEVRIGVAPAMISVLCLPKMRPAEASEAFLRGNRFSASEAARMGLINAAVPANEIDSVIQEIVSDIKAGGPEAIAAAKQLTLRVPQMQVDEAFTWTSELSASLFKGEEAQEGMRAYLDKRPPSWMND
ncbi:MAG: enoyl-CoA hydratase-related protein [Acidimicrobiales bacterium]|jgi:methylglutaconyl-CoA hydratase|nr:enoyl-CoA hydratase-related protein [Acidimicrobiales bacterium]